MFVDPSFVKFVFESFENGKDFHNMNLDIVFFIEYVIYSRLRNSS